jgi:hypothetical protein
MIRPRSLLLIAPLLLPLAAPAGGGWTVLFDGRSTEHFRSFRGTAFPASGWVVENGALRHVAGQRAGDIVTRKQYADFELELDWKVAPGGNSGIMLRVSEAEREPWLTGPELQVLDDAGHRDGRNPLTSAGSLYALVAPSAKAVRPAGQWNRARVVMRGTRLRHWLNGVEIVDCDLASPELRGKIAASKFKDMPRFAMERSGHIDLQDHGDDVWYRNIRIRELAPAR